MDVPLLHYPCNTYTCTAWWTMPRPTTCLPLLHNMRRLPQVQLLYHRHRAEHDALHNTSLQKKIYIYIYMKAELTSSRGLQTHSVPRTCPDPTPDALDTTLDHCRWGPAYQLCLESHAPIQHRRNHHKLGWLQLQWCPDAAPPAYPLQYRAQQPPPLPNLHAPPTINRHIPDNNAKPSQAPVVMQPPPEHQHPPTPTQPLNKIAGGAGDPATQHPATPATQPPPQTDRPTTRTPPAVGTQQPPAAPTTNATPPANHATPDDTTMRSRQPYQHQHICCTTGRRRPTAPPYRSGAHNGWQTKMEMGMEAVEPTMGRPTTRTTRPRRTWLGLPLQPAQLPCRCHTRIPNSLHCGRWRGNRP